MIRPIYYILNNTNPIRHNKLLLTHLKNKNHYNKKNQNQKINWKW
jgi:hypothetical protein